MIVASCNDLTQEKTNVSLDQDQTFDPDAFVAEHTPPTKTLAQQILAAEDLTTKMCDVPEWGVTLELRSPSAEERASMLERFVQAEIGGGEGTLQVNDLKQLYPGLVITCSYDPATGERIFELNEPTIAALNRKNGEVLERVALQCMDLCGLKKDSVAEGKGGSSTSPGDGSATS